MSIQTAKDARTGESSVGALLSPVESLRQARPLHAWRKDQCDAVQSIVAQLATDWHRAWGLSSVTTGRENADARIISSRDEPELPAQYNSVTPRTVAVCAWSFALLPNAAMQWQRTLHRGALTPVQSGAPLAAIHTSMYGDEAAPSATAPVGSGIAWELSAVAWTDWWRRLASLLPTSPDQNPKTAGLHPCWSGSLQLRLSWCGGTLVLEFDVEQVTALLSAHAPHLLRDTAPLGTGTRSPRVGLLSALRTQTLPLRAMLNGVELSLRQIQSLRVGDIVPLRHRLDEPTLLETPDAFVVCHGWLGQKSGQVAVEMVSPVTPTHPG